MKYEHSRHVGEDSRMKATIDWRKDISLTVIGFWKNRDSPDSSVADVDSYD